MNKLIKTVSADRLNYEFLHSLNGIIGLTERELQIFSRMLDLYISDQKSKRVRSVDCTEHRRSIIKELSISRENLSRYIQGYKKKGLIRTDKETGVNTINNAVVPIIIGGKTVQITMILKVNDYDL